MQFRGLGQQVFGFQHVSSILHKSARGPVLGRPQLPAGVHPVSRSEALGPGTPVQTQMEFLAQPPPLQAFGE